MQSEFVKDPREIVSPGQSVKVRVTSVEPGSNKIALTMREKDEVQAVREPREPREPRDDAAAGEGAARSGRERLGKIATRGAGSPMTAVGIPAATASLRCHKPSVHNGNAYEAHVSPSRTTFALQATHKSLQDAIRSNTLRMSHLSSWWRCEQLSARPLLPGRQYGALCTGGNGQQRKPGGGREKPKTTHTVGETLKAVVVNTTAYGAFVRLPDGTEALLHVSQMSVPTETVSPQARDLVKPEDEIEVCSRRHCLTRGKATLSSPSQLQKLGLSANSAAELVICINLRGYLS